LYARPRDQSTAFRPGQLATPVTNIGLAQVVDPPDGPRFTANPVDDLTSASNRKNSMQPLMDTDKHR
jgi:hypothetical protein